MTRAGPPALAILAALMVSLPATAPALQGTNDAPDAPEPIHDPAWAHTTHDALAWSTQHKHALVSPLVTGAASIGAGPAAIEAYHDGIAWADARLASADQAALTRALDTLLTQAGAPTAPANLDQVPNAYVAPLTVLLEAQQQLARDGIDVSTVMVEDPWANTRAALEDGAWLLGAVERVIPALEKAAPEAPSAPVALDVLGLVILGGEGDDVYTRNFTGPWDWSGPVVLVEPGGDDVYKVPVASRSNMGVTLPKVGRAGFFADNGALAIEMDGNDTYRSKAAYSRGIGTQHVLIEEQGNDTYGKLSRPLNVAASEAGFTFLGDRAGNDTYRVKEEGIGYAIDDGLIRNEAIAILGDWQGNDTYETKEDTKSTVITGQALGRAVNVGALAVVRDYEGDDDYRATSSAYGSADRDGVGYMIDDAGNDSYHLQYWHGFDSFGNKWTPGHAVPTGPAARSVAELLDGNGNDTYTWDKRFGDPEPLGDNITRVKTGPHKRYSVFIDCVTPSNASYPCQAEHEQVFSTIVEHECAWTPLYLDGFDPPGWKAVRDAIGPTVNPTCEEVGNATLSLLRASS